MKRGLLLVDIDQVVCDFVTPFCEWGNKVFGKDVSPADVDCYDMFKLFGIPDELAATFTIEAFFESNTPIPEVPGAVQGMKKLADEFRIWYVTARPRSATENTVMWMEDRGIRHRIIHCSSADKIKAVENFRRHEIPVRGMIEDNPDTAMEAAGQGWEVWLLDYPYNQEASHGCLTRVKDWPELVKRILETEDYAPGLTMSELEYTRARFMDELHRYLKALSGRPCEVEYQQVSKLPDGQLRLEFYLKVVS